MEGTTVSKLRARLPRCGPRQLFGLLIVVFLLAAWWVFLRPTTLGGETTLVTVSGTSMQPGMYTGDLAIVRDTDDYVVGDVIAYRPSQGDESSVVIHRIVGGDAETGFVMRGDNNDFEDPWLPRPNQVAGELWWHVPHAGTVVAALRDPLLAASGCAALTVFLVMSRAGRDDEDEPGARMSETGAAR